MAVVGITENSSFQNVSRGAVDTVESGVVDLQISDDGADFNYGSTDYQLGLGDGLYGNISSLLLFDIVSRVTEGATINSAYLYLYGGGSAGDFLCESTRMLKPWAPLGATWNVSESGLNWQLPGARGSEDSDSPSPAVVHSGGYFEFDVVDQVQAAVDAGVDYGNKVGAVNYNAGQGFRFITRSTGTDLQRPELWISYSEPVVTSFSADGGYYSRLSGLSLRGQMNDKEDGYLRSRGLSGSLNDMKNQHLGSLGYTGSLSEKLKEKADLEGYDSINEMLNSSGIIDES